jgi:hypothetical protein
MNPHEPRRPDGRKLSGNCETKSSGPGWRNGKDGVLARTILTADKVLDY